MWTLQGDTAGAYCTDEIVRIGGCSVTGNDPRWRCHDCGFEFGFQKGKDTRQDILGEKLI